MKRYYRNTLFALIGTLPLAHCSKEEATSNASRKQLDADVVADPNCQLTQTAYPKLRSETYLQNVSVVNNLNKTSSLCELQREQAASQIVAFSLINKNTLCTDCWSGVFKLLKNAQDEQGLDIFTHYVRNDASTNLDEVYIPLDTPFGIVVDKFAHLKSQLKENAGAAESALLLIDTAGHAFWVAENAAKDQKQRDQMLDDLSQFIKEAIHAPRPADEQQTEDPQDPDDEEIMGDPLAAGLAVISLEDIKKELTLISDDKYLGRLSGTAGQKDVATYVKSIISAHNVRSLKPDSFEQQFTLSVGPLRGKPTANLIAKIEGNDPTLKNEYIVIGAHLDHAGTLDLGYTCSAGPSGDRICNGADDNGSGSIAVLNVMKALAKVQKKLKRSVLFFWFSGEEEGLLGSYHYVNKEPIVALNAIKYMINLDMVGYIHTNGKRLGALGGQTSAAGAQILKDIDQKNTDFAIQITSSAGGGSDHVPFMGKGIPGVFFHTGVSNNPNYHRTGDSSDKISYEGIEFAAKTSFELIYRMANADNRTFASPKTTRVSLLTEDEMRQTCHHLMNNPYVNLMSHGRSIEE